MGLGHPDLMTGDTLFTYVALPTNVSSLSNYQDREHEYEVRVAEIFVLLEIHTRIYEYLPASVHLALESTDVQ